MICRARFKGVCKSNVHFDEFAEQSIFGRGIRLDLLTVTGGVGCTTPSSQMTPIVKGVLGRCASVDFQGMGMQFGSVFHGSLNK